MMRYEDQLRSHPGYFKAALAAIDLYVRIHDKPDLTEEILSKQLKRYAMISEKLMMQRPSRRQSGNEQQRRLRRQSKRPKRQRPQPAMGRRMTRLHPMMIPMEPSCSRPKRHWTML